MTKVSDLYNLWLKAHHLPETGATATIETATVEELHPRPNKTESRIVLKFKGKERRLIVQERNANRLADIGGDDYRQWPGLTIRLRPEKWGKNRTITIESLSTGEGGDG